MRRHWEREHEGESCPMMINSTEAVVACRILFSLFHRRDNSLQVAARGVSMDLSLCKPIGGFGQSVELVVRSCTGEVLSLTVNAFA